MNYKLELDNSEQPILRFKNIIFDSFKINVVERFSTSKNINITYSHILIKLRTSDDKIIKTKNGTVSKKLGVEDFKTYGSLSRALNGWKYRNDKEYRLKAENDFVQYIMFLALDHYDFQNMS